MGVRPSRLHYEIAQQAYHEAERLSREYGLVRPTGAIVAYLRGYIDARQVWSQVTYLEVNEYARLEPPTLVQWYDCHEHLRPCGPLTRLCTLPPGRFHHITCPGFRQLPPRISLFQHQTPVDTESLDGSSDAASSEYTDESRSWSGSYDGSSVYPQPRHDGGMQGHHDGHFDPFDYQLEDEELSDSTSILEERETERRSQGRGGHHGNIFATSRWP